MVVSGVEYLDEDAELYPDGSVHDATLARDVTIQGLPCAGGRSAVFFPSGRLRLAWLARAKTKGLDLRKHTNYDVTVADVNGDGRPDVIIMYESANETRSGLQDGSIQVFLNRGVEGAAVKSQKKK